MKTTDGGLKVIVAARVGYGMEAGIAAPVTRVGRCLGIGDVFEGGGGSMGPGRNVFRDEEPPKGCPVTRSDSSRAWRSPHRS